MPGLLFWGIGALYTFKFAGLLYNKVTAQLAVLIYLSAAHLVISNNDVRAEPFLTGLIIGSVFHFSKAKDKKIGIDLLLGSVYAAMAVMTKGPFALIIIGGGFIIDWTLKKNWKEMFNGRWIIALVLIFIFILPELYSLYMQFDLHPEKKVFDKYGVSGIRFFFWDSQFGRFFNNGPIKGKGDPFFYFHTILWAFLPWSLLLYASLIWKFKNFRSQSMEYINIGIIIVTFLLFSLSSFQLPHYMNIIFPFFAIQLAQYLFLIRANKTLRTIQITQTSICILLCILATTLTIFYRPDYLIASIIFLGFGLIFTIWFSRQIKPYNFFGISFIAACLTFLFLNFFFYPSLLKYQSGSEAAFYLNQNFPGKKIAAYETSSYSFDFYANSNIQFLNSGTIDSAANNESLIIFTRQDYLDSLTLLNHEVRLIKSFPHFRISQLTGKFINHKTRTNSTTAFALAELRTYDRKKHD